eukprot:TRINITY_DN1857_c0_g1_i1.p1 TRINITY_DN1857_c0_g1~~TRINITY_DN1857_c0_g1_i1.p1  ORF type:complete len:745 (+),score=140.84 TRINITY_DN1857_c0_g1_i1:100-2334(+)
MSAMLGRTWNYITATVGPDCGSIKWTPPKDLSDPSADLPKGLAAFLRSLLNEPDSGRRIIRENIELVKAKLDEPRVKDASVADGLLRMIVADLHGFDVSFACVHALKLAQKGGSLSHKKIGYLASVALLKDPEDPLNLLLVNTILKDLGSKNIVEINLALIASSSHIIPDEVLPLLLPSLTSKTTHIKDFIRKKALSSIHGLLKRKPELASQLEAPTRRCLMDTSPGVLSVALQMAKDLAPRVDLRDALPGILDIAEQILEERLPKETSYKGLCAPWILFDVISLVSVISGSCGRMKIETSERIGQLLKRLLGRSASKEMIAYALTYECIKGISVLDDKGLRSELLTKALPFVSKFLQDKNSNVKYMGIASMELLFGCNEELSLTSDQEKVVSSCLNYPDETIRRKTLSLLYVLANEKNVKQICKTLLNYIKESDDKVKRREFLEKASDLTQKFKASQGLDWYVNILLRLSQVSPSDMKHEFILRIKKVLGSPNLEEQAVDVGHKLIEVLSRFLKGEEGRVSKSMIGLYIWCWSRFESKSQWEDFSLLLNTAQKADVEEVLLDALFYIFTQNPSNPFPTQPVMEYILKSCQGGDSRIADKALELELLLNLLKNETFPSASSEKDFTLSFLDGYILEQAKANDLSPYRTKLSLLCDSPLESETDRLRLTPYNEIKPSGPQKDVQPLLDSPVWSLNKCNKGPEESHSLSKKHSDSLESFFVEEKNQFHFGLDSLCKEDLLQSEDDI